MGDNPTLTMQYQKMTNKSSFKNMSYLEPILIYMYNTIQDRTSNAANTGALMAHEMGHNFGLQHDDGMSFHYT